MIKSKNASTVSLIVPIRDMAGKFRNLEKWLPAAIEQGMQVILVEDLFDSLTSEQLKELVSKFGSRIKTIQGNFGSPGAARNAGFMYATGDWIIFWDSDDVGYPIRVSEVLQGIDEKTDVVVTSFSVYDWQSDSPIEDQLVKDHRGTFLEIVDQPGLWRMIMKKKFIDQVSFLPISMAEDQIFIAELSLLKPNIDYRSEICYAYFKRVPNQLTSNHVKMEDLKKSTNYLAELIRIHPKEQLLKEFYVRQILSGVKYGRPKLKIQFTLKLINAILLFPNLITLKIINKKESKS